MAQGIDLLKLNEAPGTGPLPATAQLLVKVPGYPDAEFRAPVSRLPAPQVPGPNARPGLRFGFSALTRAQLGSGGGMAFEDFDYANACMETEAVIGYYLPDGATQARTNVVLVPVFEAASTRKVFVDGSFTGSPSVPVRWVEALLGETLPAAPDLSGSPFLLALRDKPGSTSGERENVQVPVELLGASVVALTVAELQARAGSYVPGQYLVTDAPAGQASLQSPPGSYDTAPLTVWAYSKDRLAPFGMLDSRPGGYDNTLVQVYDNGTNELLLLTLPTIGAGVYRGEFEENTAYLNTQLVSYQGGLYAALNTFTSGSGFDPADWDKLADGPGTPAPLRDIYAIGDNAAVVGALTASGHTWSKGDLTAYGTSAEQQDAAPPAVSGQPTNVLVGTADVKGGDTFDRTDYQGDAWRYTYCRRNDGTYGWTRLMKTV